MALSGTPADHARSTLYWQRETAGVANYGTVPGSGTPDELNFLTESLTGDRTFIRSSQAKASRLRGPRKEVAKQADGKNITMDVGPGAQMTAVLEMAMMSTITAALSISAATISFTVTTNVIADSGSGFGSIKVGTWIRIAGATNSENNGDAYVTAAAAGQITVEGLTLVTEAAGATVTIDGQHIRTGTTVHSASIERYRGDFTTDPYQIYPGNVVNGLTLGFTPQTLFTLSASFNNLGPNAVTGSTSFANAAAAPESYAIKLADASNDLSTFRVDGTSLTDVTEFNFTVGNNLTWMPVSGAIRPCYPSKGSVDLTGAFSGYLIDGATLQDDMFAATRRRVDFGIIPTVVSGSVDYYFTFHRVSFDGFGDTARDSEQGPAMLASSWDYEEDDQTSGLDDDVAMTISVLPVA